MESIKLAKYVPTGNIIHVDDANNGLSCNCTCLACDGKFEAVQGSREWHFRHYVKKDCQGAQETALHKLAKQIIVESNEIILPEQGKIIYSEAVAEKPLGTFRPDVTVNLNGKPLYFEVTVTHRVDEPKWLFYEKEQHNSVEIDIEHLVYEIPSLEEIKRVILEDALCKQVIFWKKEDVVFPPVAKKGAKQEAPTPTGLVGLLLTLLAFFGFLFFSRKNESDEKRFGSNRKYGKNRSWRSKKK